MDRQSRNKIAYVTIGLIILNAIYFLYLEIATVGDHGMFMLMHGAMYTNAIKDREYYRLLTSVFMHFDISHIMNNMLVLFVLGGYLERALGKWKYFICYILCGLGSNLVSAYRNISEQIAVISAGASGAIFGVIGALLYVVVVNHGKLENLSSRQLLIMCGFSLYFGFTSSGVDNIAHVSGLCIGIILAAILYRKPKSTPEEG